MSDFSRSVSFFFSHDELFISRMCHAKTAGLTFCIFRMRRKQGGETVESLMGVIGALREVTKSSFPEMYFWGVHSEKWSKLKT